jgi:putative sporulation protein YtaF
MENLHLLSIILLSVSTNLDNFGVGFAYGIRRVCVPLKTNIFIALVNATGTLVSMAIGERLYFFMQPETATGIGAFLFLMAGGWLLARDLYGRLRKRPPAYAADTDVCGIRNETVSVKSIISISRYSAINQCCAGIVSAREGVVLALALTFSNLVTGVGAALIGLNIIITTLLVFLAGIIALFAGTRLGSYSGRRWISGMPDPVSGLLLIVIAIYELVS